ncbi:MAG: restriction endonuclease subunit S [Desulfovibrionaceae bacterium]|nr:restriction endonuclease subunit S [Desulfovibrionaceae bacterium]
MTLADAEVILLDCVHKTPSAQPSGIPYIAIPQMKNGELDPTDARHISPRDFKEWTSKALPIRHDIVLSRRCNPGATAYVRGNFQFALGQNLVLLRSKGTEVLPEFLRWLVRSPGWWEQIQKFLNVGAVFDSLRCADIPNFQFTIPPVDEQRVITSILSSLDDKIDLNRRMNETLEAMARAIFKDWFVDFGPTRAKMEGRAPYLAKEIWDLFPDALDDERKPVGWVLKPLAECFEIIGGGTPKTSVAEYWGEGIPWFSVVDTPPPGCVFVVETEKSITACGLKESSARLVPAGTTIISARGTVGNLAMTACDMAFNQSCYALRGDGGLGDSFVFLAAQHMVDRLKSMAHGSVFSTITRQTFEAITLPVPGNDFFSCFENVAAPLFLKIKSNVIETRTLAQTRDLLLPKLMSGEIRFKDAEKAVGAML